MNVTVSFEKDLTVLTPIGPRLDAVHTLGFKEQMRKAISDTSGPLMLDLKMVEFLDSSGLGAIVAMSRVLGSERRLDIRSLNPLVQRVFTLTQMDKVFRICATANLS